MKLRKHYKGIFLIIILIIITVSMLSIFRLIEMIIKRNSESPESPDYTDSGDSRVYYNGQWYTRDDDVETLLVLGIDSITAADGTRDDSAQADFVALIVMDNGSGTYRILHINRDTMTDINQLDKYGSRYGVFTAQLALAHTYGAEGRMQCRNTVDAVENLLYGVDIDHYLSVTMDAVAIVNDSIGGVTVTLNEDFPALGEGCVKGSKITLKGDQALTFVRYRNNEAESSNLERMERQRQYIGAVFEQYNDADTENTVETMMKVSEYMVSDCTVNKLSDILELLKGYTYEGTVPLAGEAVKGDVYVEFYVDEAALRKTVIDLFYELEA